MITRHWEGQGGSDNVLCQEGKRSRKRAEEISDLLNEILGKSWDKSGSYSSILNELSINRTSLSFSEESWV